MVVNVETFRTIGARIKRTPGRINDRDFKALFGVHPVICNAMWHLMDVPKSSGIVPKHLLWGLLFMTVYGKETVLCTMTETSPKTYRKWVWMVLPRMAGTYPTLVSGHCISLLLSSSLF